MKETINIKIAANDKLKIIEEKLFVEKIGIGIIISLIAFSFFGITLQMGIILSLILIWLYKTDKKEHKRMRELYGL
jgi:hypothetical protein